MFNVGDKVVCVDDDGTRIIIEGGLYEVEKVDYNGEEIYLKGIPFAWMPQRFKLVTKVEQLSPFVVWEKEYV